MLFRSIILCSNNEKCLKLNSKIISKIPGRLRESIAVNTPVMSEDENPDMIPIEILDTLDLPGIPPHKLELKTGAIYMLIRNFNLKLGLCNGTRFQLLPSFSNKLLHGRVIPNTPLAPGERAVEFYLPRFDLDSPDDSVYKFRRRQFPIIPAHAVTINKSQGSTFDLVGVDLRDNCFSHGQVYTAFSRVRRFSSLKILLLPGRTSTKNIINKAIISQPSHSADIVLNLPEDPFYYNQQDYEEQA